MKSVWLGTGENWKINTWKWVTLSGFLAKYVSKICSYNFGDERENLKLNTTIEIRITSIKAFSVERQVT